MTTPEAIERVREHIDPRWSRVKVERELSAIEERLAARQNRRFWLVGALSVASATAAVLLYQTRGFENTALDEPMPSVELAARTPRAKAPNNAASLAREPGKGTELAAAEELEADMVFDEDDTADEPGRPRAKRHGKRTRRERARLEQTGSRVVVAGQAWRSLAKEGRYHEAYRALSEDKEALEHTVDDLLLAGDAARLSGHPREAVPYYREALARAGNGPRAHLAAHTLGRTLLHELGDGRAAAQAFARAYAAAPKGPLAEEARIGEVESYMRAGDRAAARKAAEAYLQAFPNGRRAKDFARLVEP